ncbi:MAG: DNA-directed RNA polymerase subunit omega [Lachnospiraceae bacterium]|jgi:DNA-directed RNA polymerase subunit omega|nr:DNA-directed RNA polymerase subunit omega [Lachnospiraceae bacterium]
MIHPSYVDLMAVVNKDVEEGETPVINSRYSIVMATAKRARQIVDGDEPLVKVSRGEKPLSIAVDELNQGEIRILAEDEVEEDFIGNEETAADADEGAEMIAEDAAADAEDSAAEDEILPEEEMTVEEEAGEAEE